MKSTLVWLSAFILVVVLFGVSSQSNVQAMDTQTTAGWQAYGMTLWQYRTVMREVRDVCAQRNSAEKVTNRADRMAADAKTEKEVSEFLKEYAYFLRVFSAQRQTDTSGTIWNIVTTQIEPGLAEGPPTIEQFRQDPDTFCQTTK